jgi:hypothetical protein
VGVIEVVVGGILYSVERAKRPACMDQSGVQYGVVGGAVRVVLV